MDPMKRLSDEEFTQLEYEQASEDWRHRDNLTWQIPAVLVAVAGFVVSEVFGASNLSPNWIRPGMLAIAATLGVLLSVALIQNLKLQRKSKDIIKSLHDTERLEFPLMGSNLLIILSWGVSIALLALFVREL